MIRIHNIKVYDRTTGHYTPKIRNLDETQTIHLRRLLETQGYSVLVESYDISGEPVNHNLPHHSEEYVSMMHAIHVFYIRTKIKLFKLMRKIK